MTDLGRKGLVMAGVKTPTVCVLRRRAVLLCRSSLWVSLGFELAGLTDGQISVVSQPSQSSASQAVLM